MAKRNRWETVKLNGSRVTLELEEGESQELRMSDLRREIIHSWLTGDAFGRKGREQAKDLIEDLPGPRRNERSSRFASSERVR